MDYLIIKENSFLAFHTKNFLRVVFHPKKKKKNLIKNNA